MSVFNSTPPKINKNNLILWLKKNYNLFKGHNLSLKELNSERDKNYLIKLNRNKQYIVKISNSLETKGLIDLQDYALTALSKKPIINKIIPKKIHKNVKIYTDENNSKSYVRILSFIKGTLFAKINQTKAIEISLGYYLGILSKELQNLGHPAAFRKFEWDPSSIDWIKSNIDFFKNKKNKILKKNYIEFKHFVSKNKNNLRYSLTHGDANNYNLLVQKNKIVGLLDYGDMVFAPTINDLAICLSYALMGKVNFYYTLKNIVQSYHNEFPITDDETYSIISLVKARLCITVIMAEKQIKKFPKNKYLTISQKSAWDLLFKLDKININHLIHFIRSFCNYPIFNKNNKIYASKIGISKSFFEFYTDTKDLIKKRKINLSDNFSIAYKKPIQLLEGKIQYLYDENCKEYLDCVNNISHVGHCHPLVHQALIKQNLKLNTNTRYLYKIINDYSDKLLSKFPKKLDTIFFVCTGSEANDLAYRIAREYTGAKDVLVIDNAYHGHTNSLINLSPYKFKGKGGKGKKSHVHVAEMPDGIRGRWLYSDKNWVSKYINQVMLLIENIKNNNKKLSCFFTESILSCGGQIILPKNYLKKVFKIVKQNKGLCIVDEVQTGFGRVGKNFWAFEEHGVIPDIVTLGKPMGNGHPIAAVVTTKQIAKKFNNGMEYFNSFGGNPVSCAVGNTVLDIIDSDKLQINALKVGEYFLKKLKLLKKQYPKLISEVRGKGLFLGIDLIKDGDNFLPNKLLALNLINHMKNKGILLSTDGPYSNVIKIKPSLYFNKSNVNFVYNELNLYLSKIK